jgi:hypothetical protein
MQENALFRKTGMDVLSVGDEWESRVRYLEDSGFIVVLGCSKGFRDFSDI